MDKKIIEDVVDMGGLWKDCVEAAKASVLNAELSTSVFAGAGRYYSREVQQRIHDAAVQMYKFLTTSEEKGEDLYHDADTMNRVFDAIASTYHCRDEGEDGRVCDCCARDITESIGAMQNAGILFRERPPQVVMGFDGSKSSDHVAVNIAYASAQPRPGI